MLLIDERENKHKADIRRLKDNAEDAKMRILTDLYKQLSLIKSKGPSKSVWDPERKVEIARLQAKAKILKAVVDSELKSAIRQLECFHLSNSSLDDLNLISKELPIQPSQTENFNAHTKTSKDMGVSAVAQSVPCNTVFDMFDKITQRQNDLEEELWNRIDRLENLWRVV